MAQVISVCNHKGGCGKTTSALNIAAALAELGQHTLVVDLDPQANLTISVGIQPNMVEHPIADALLNGTPAQPISIAKHLDIIPTNIGLADAELELASKIGREVRLKKALEPMLDKYKYILIDCPPSMQILAVNALVAATAVYVPLQAQYLALQGMAKIEQVIDDVKATINPAIELAGIFITQYDSRKTLHRNVEQLARDTYGSKVCTAVIRDNVTLSEAPIAGQTIYQYSPKSKGAVDYMALAKEIRKRTK